MRERRLQGLVGRPEGWCGAVVATTPPTERGRAARHRMANRATSEPHWRSAGVGPAPRRHPAVRCPARRTPATTPARTGLTSRVLPRHPRRRPFRGAWARAAVDPAGGWMPTGARRAPGTARRAPGPPGATPAEHPRRCGALILPDGGIIIQLAGTDRCRCKCPGTGRSGSHATTKTPVPPIGAITRMGGGAAPAAADRLAAADRRHCCGATRDAKAPVSAG